LEGLGVRNIINKNAAVSASVESTTYNFENIIYALLPKLWNFSWPAVSHN
jgi:hypothetical protein